MVWELGRVGVTSAAAGEIFTCPVAFGLDVEFAGGTTAGQLLMGIKTGTVFGPPPTGNGIGLTV